MAARRRRGRRVFRGPKRPFRWSADSPATDVEPIGSGGWVIGTIPNEGLLINAGVPPYASLVSGEFDVEDWADDQEVTIDRIVGDISWVGFVRWDAAVAAVPKLVVRAGIIVAEDITDDPTADEPTRSLFDLTDLQEAEWMWLYQFAPLGPGFYNPETGVVEMAVNHTVHVDIKNRRKLGQKDELYLYTSYMHENGSSAFTQNVKCIDMLRVGMMSR